MGLEPGVIWNVNLLLKVAMPTRPLVNTLPA
jgi:hypothetical protein